MFTLINVSFSHHRKLLSLPDLYLSIVLSISSFDVYPMEVGGEEGV